MRASPALAAALTLAAAFVAASPAEAKRGVRFSFGSTKPAPKPAAAPNGGWVQTPPAGAPSVRGPVSAAKPAPSSSGGGMVIIPLPRTTTQPVQPAQEAARAPVASPGMASPALPAQPAGPPRPTTIQAAAVDGPGQGFSVVAPAGALHRFDRP